MFIISETFNCFNLLQFYRAIKTRIFPEENVLPSNCKEVRQLLVELGIAYKQIH